MKAAEMKKTLKANGIDATGSKDELQVERRLRGSGVVGVLGWGYRVGVAHRCEVCSGVRVWCEGRFAQRTGGRGRARWRNGRLRVGGGWVRRERAGEGGVVVCLLRGCAAVWRARVRGCLACTSARLRARLHAHALTCARA
eukprot:3595866-Pleurochrysis_carterae.AAC.1